MHRVAVIHDIGLHSIYCALDTRCATVWSDHRPRSDSSGSRACVGAPERTPGSAGHRSSQCRLPFLGTRRRYEGRSVFADVHLLRRWRWPHAPVMLNSIAPTWARYHVRSALVHGDQRRGRCTQRMRDALDSETAYAFHRVQEGRTSSQASRQSQGDAALNGSCLTPVAAACHHAFFSSRIYCPILLPSEDTTPLVESHSGWLWPYQIRPCQAVGSLVREWRLCSYTSLAPTS
ncbi:hypothetical protein C8Q76DRAFT_210505 [Earliella scabrosa]|nr:hypothetical protein C8Q76DRAFT_210505 [Earliella scabrosa]